MIDHVLPYLKASVEDDDGPGVLALADDSPVLVPYVGRLLISYVVDERDAVRFVTEGELRATGASSARLHAAALANFARKIEVTGVRIAPSGNVLAILYEGNFEATLLLWNDLWPHVHAKLGRDLFAVAPARDVLAVSSPAHIGELRDVVARIWPGGDHLLTRDVLRRAEDGWLLHRED